jgi:hypothetical protein
LLVRQQANGLWDADKEVSQRKDLAGYTKHLTQQMATNCLKGLMM